MNVSLSLGLKTKKKKPKTPLLTKVAFKLAFTRALFELEVSYKTHSEKMETGFWSYSPIDYRGLDWWLFLQLSSFNDYFRTFQNQGGHTPD